MDYEESANGDSNSWSSETNWTVVRGSLVNSITFESSLSVINADDGFKSTSKRCPLVLKPAAPDSRPCEIKISFAQKHELRQIYVKSTARVYEIYSQSNRQSEREYVWTVRCSAAARDEDDEVLSADSNGSKENFESESNGTGCEDQWVKVKAPDSSLTLIKPEYHEATAQLSDLDPCLSVVLRFLSVQGKDSVFVDEVYVLADLVEATESENQVGQTEASNRSSAMAMLLPSLLLMSKTKNSYGTEDNHTFETWKKPNLQEIVSEASCSRSTTVATKVQDCGIKSTEKVGFGGVNVAGVNATKLQGPPKFYLWERQADEAPANAREERSLDQLFSRIGRIEDMFLRLEDNLLKPINGIEARLERVEQQLEVLTSKQKTTEPPVYTRFWAPNFSSVLSDSNSFSRSENDYHPRSEEIESNAKSFHSDVQTNQSGGIYDSENATMVLPSHVITAPEFSSCDDGNEEENQASDIVSEPSADHPKRALTVDDALAAALTGLMIHAENHTQTLSIEAPEFSNNDDIEANEKDSPTGQRDLGTDWTGSENGSLAITSNPSLDAEQDVLKSFEHVPSEKAKEDDVQYKHREEGAADETSGRSIDQSIDKNEEFITEANDDDIDADDTNQVDASSCADSTAPAEDSEGGTEDKTRNSLHEILESSFAAPLVVDFEFPVLDVKFLSHGSRESNFSLNALLSELPGTKSGEATSVAEESQNAAPNENDHFDLISVVPDGEPVAPVISSKIFVDFNYCTLQVPLSTEDETPLASDIPCCHETFPTTLI